jgi:regulator of protease activity HflC (stomatin/prohibitin superfamily)
MSGPDKRGEVVALVGCVLCASLAVILGILAHWSDASSAWAAALLTLAGVGTWLITLIQLHQRRLVAEERLEVAELERSRQEMLGGARTIFQEEELDQMETLAMGRRLRSVERFLVPTLALLTASYEIVAGVGILPWFRPFSFVAAAAAATMLNQTAVLFFAGGIAFICFMFSRYALGMSRLPEWSLLRAGGNFMFGASAAGLGVAVAVLCVISGLSGVEHWLSSAIGVAMIVLAVETILNYVLDYYRPRTGGPVQRAFYDSRLLGMFSEPGGILRSLANAVDYQFGFKVSETWFYRLLGRIVVPLSLVQIVVIFALTCITVVPPGNKAVIEHLGSASAVLGSGVALTWPWPVDRATIIPVDVVQRLEIGYERAVGEDQREISEGAILWTKRHYKKEYQLLVADRLAGLSRGGDGPSAMKGSAGGKAPPVNLLSMNMSVQWRVGDTDPEVLRYYAQAADARKILEALAYRELTRYAASADVLDLLGKGGITAADTLAERLQAACDTAGYDGGSLGVTIVHVGIGGVHPPPDDDVAKSYEEVVGAIESRDAKIKLAEGEAAQVRVRSAGTEWEELYNAIRAEDEARTMRRADLPAKTAEVERQLRSEAGGGARAIASIAEKNTLSKVFRRKAEAEQHAMQSSAFNTAPDIYTMRVYLKILAETLERIQKYVVVVDDPNKLVIEADLKPPQAIDILGAEARAADMRQQQTP